MNVSNLSQKDFEDIACKLISGMGYVVESARTDGNKLEILGMRKDPLSDFAVLVHIERGKKRMGVKAARNFYKSISEKYAEGVLISLSGFSENTKNFAEEKHIRLIDEAEFLALLLKYELTSPKTSTKSPREVILRKKDKKQKQAFIFKMTEEGARKYFEKKRGRIFSILGAKEKITGAERRYAPVGSFTITRKDEVEVGTISKTKKMIEVENTFYVNLNNAELYCARGISGKNPGISVFDVVEKIMDLPTMSIQLLSDIMRKNEISHRELNKKHFLFLDGNIDHILILETRGLIKYKSILPQSLRSTVVGYVSNINIADFGKPGYNLKKFLSVGSMGKYECDAIVYEPEDMLYVLKTFFGGTGKFNEIIYMPYDKCRYADKKGRFRYEKIISPKFN